MFAPVRINRLTDQRLAALANSLLEKLPSYKIEVTYLGGQRGSFSEPLDIKSFPKKSWSISRISLIKPAEGKYIDFCRGAWMGGESADRDQFSARRVSSPFDEYSMFFKNVPFEVQEATSVDKLTQPFRVDSMGSVEGDTDLNAIISNQLDQLRQLSIEFSERQLEAETRLEQSFRSREEALERRLEDEEARLAERRERAREEIEKERRGIEKWRSEINDREPQHERRRLRETLTDQLRDFLHPKDPSDSFKSDRGPYYLQIFLGLALLLISAALTLQAGLDNPNAEALWILGLKSALLGGAGVGFLWSGLAGLKKSVSRQEEFRREIQRYGYDMDRASWVVETILQMNSIEAQKVPDEWLEAVCHGLFASPEVAHTDEKSLDALAALLDATAKARVGTNGFEFELDKRGLRSTVKQAS